MHVGLCQGRGRERTPQTALRHESNEKTNPPPKKKEKRKEKVKINFFTILQMRQSPVQAGERLRKKKAESWCRQRIPWRFTLTGSHPRLPSSVAALRSNSSPSRWPPRRAGWGWSSSQTPLPRAGLYPTRPGAPWKTPLARLCPPRSRRRWAPVSLLVSPFGHANFCFT